MMQFTQAEHDQLIRRVANTLSNFQPGEDAIAVLSRIYQENLPDKSPREGKLMAEELVFWISRFRSSYDAAQTDLCGHVRYALTDALQALPVEEQCRTLSRIIGRQEGAGPVTEKDRDVLMEEAVRLLTRNTDLPSAGEDYALRHRVKQHCGEEMTLAATAMILYTMAKNGELSGVPSDITLAQTALCVCTEDTQCQLLWAEANGYMTHKRVQVLMQALSVTFKTLWLICVIPLTVSAFVAEGALAITAGGLVTLGAMALLTAYAFREFDEMLSFGAEMITEVPLKLQSIQSLPLEEPQLRTHSTFPAALAEEEPAVVDATPDPELLEEEDAEDFLSF